MTSDATTTMLRKYVLLCRYDDVMLVNATSVPGTISSVDGSPRKSPTSWPVSPFSVSFYGQIMRYTPATGANERKTLMLPGVRVAAIIYISQTLSIMGQMALRICWWYWWWHFLCGKFWQLIRVYLFELILNRTCSGGIFLQGIRD